MLSFNPYSIGFYSLIELGNLKIEESSHGFNPYSIGFYSLIMKFLKYSGILFMFQSLFYWILFSYPFYIEDSLFLTLIEFF